MALYLLSKLKPGLAYEVVSFDKAKHTAVLRDSTGALMTDIQFYIDIIRRCYDLTDQRPAPLKE